MKFVSIVIGSRSDYEIMKSCSDTLEAFGVKYEMVISSAHRSPERTKEYIEKAEKKGAQVFYSGGWYGCSFGGCFVF